MLDKVFNISPLIFVIISLVLFVLHMKKIILRKQIVKKKSFFDKILDKVNEIDYLKNMKENLSFKFSIITGRFDYKNDLKVIKMLVFVFIIALVGTVYVSKFTNIWYLFVIAFLFLIGVPLFGFELYYEYKVKKRSLQIPEATEALSLGFDDTNTLIGGIREALPQMRKEIRAELERLSYSLEQDDPEASINKFIQKTPDKWMKVLGTIFLSYIKNGGDLTVSLDYFNDNVTHYILYREKTKSKMFLPKAIIFMMYALIPLAIYMNSKMFPVAKVIHFTDVEALKLLLYAVVSNTIALIGVFILQRT